MVLSNYIYQHEAQSRSWGTWFSFFSGVLIIAFGIAIFIFKSKLFGLFPVVLGIVIVYGSLGNLRKNYHWKLSITNKKIDWTGPKEQGRIEIDDIVLICVESGDGAFLKIDLKNGNKVKIPRHFYGDEIELVNSLKKLPNKFEILI